MSCTHDCGCTPEIRDARTDEWVQIAPESARPATLTPEQPVKAPGQGGDILLKRGTAVEVEWLDGNRRLRYADEGGYQVNARHVGNGRPFPWDDGRIVRVLTEDKPVDTEDAVYLSGPMTGLPDFNRPAFHAAAAALRAQGYVVINPAEVARLTAERDALAAKVARVEALAGQWERMAATAINPDTRAWLQAFAETLQWRVLRRRPKMHAALAGSEADTSDVDVCSGDADCTSALHVHGCFADSAGPCTDPDEHQPTGQEAAPDAGHKCEPCYSRSECGQCGWQEQWCVTCSRQMCGCATETTNQEDQS